jgi:hypothetical protein
VKCLIIQPVWIEKPLWVGKYRQGRGDAAPLHHILSSAPHISRWASFYMGCSRGSSVVSVTFLGKNQHHDDGVYEPGQEDPCEMRPPSSLPHSVSRKGGPCSFEARIEGLLSRVLSCLMILTGKVILPLTGVGCRYIYRGHCIQ